MSLPAMLMRAADLVADATGLLDRPFDQAGLLRSVLRGAPGADFGGENIDEPLSRLLAAYAGEANLSAFGRFAVGWDMRRFLSNLLRLRAAERADPSIIAAPVERPIFITGLPRAGTSFLHTLLAQDPATLVPRQWQCVYPYPAAGEKPNEPGSRPVKVDRQLRLFARLAPGFDMAHPFSSWSPQECSEITAHVLRSLRFDTTHVIPSYRAWLDATGHMEAYRFHKRFLQHLQHQSGPGRWIVKCPDHVFALDAIRAVYPDARLVFVHRDPLRVLASVSHLTAVLRRPFTRHVDNDAIGRQVSSDWAAGAAHMIEACAGGTLPAGSVMHVHYTALTADPLGTVRDLYRHFDMALSDAAQAAISATIAARPNGGYGTHDYRFETFGLDPTVERRRFADYVDCFHIETETARRTSRSRMPSLAS